MSAHTHTLIHCYRVCVYECTHTHTDRERMLMCSDLVCPGVSISSCKPLHTHTHTPTYTHPHTLPRYCSYNALKFHFQAGDVNQQLSASSHLLCASLSGQSNLTHTKLQNKHVLFLLFLASCNILKVTCKIVWFFSLAFCRKLTPV